MASIISSLSPFATLAPTVTEMAAIKPGIGAATFPVPGTGVPVPGAGPAASALAFAGPGAAR